MLIDALLLALGAALAGLLGAVSRAQAWAGPPPGALGRADLAVALAGWLAVPALLLLALRPAEPAWALLPALLAAAPTRSEALARRLAGLAPLELVELRFAALLGLLACVIAQAERWLRRPPEGVEPGAAGLGAGLGLPLLAALALSLALPLLARRR